MKILHIIQGYGGGISSIVKNLIMSNDSDVVHQDVMSFTYDQGEAFISELNSIGAKTYLMPRPRKNGFICFCKYVKSVLREGQYDVVHCHSDGWRAAIFCALAKSEHVPTFCIHAHRTSNGSGRIISNKLYIRMEQFFSRCCADVRFTCGQEAAKFIYGTTDGSILIPNGIDPARCRKAAEIDIESYRRAIGVEDHEQFLIQIGRLVVQKNISFSLNLAWALKQCGLPFKLVLVGAGPLEEEIRTKIAEMNLNDQILLLGRRNDVYELMTCADVMILPSLWEGLPTVAVEAQAMGLPCVIADTVTTECDLELGLVRFLPIDDIMPWADEFRKIGKTSLTLEQRLCVLENNAYTAASSFARYISTLRQ